MILIDDRQLNFLVGAILTGASTIAMAAARTEFVVVSFPVFIYGLALLIRNRKPKGSAYFRNQLQRAENVRESPSIEDQ